MSTIELRSCNGTAAFSCPNQSRLELVTRAKHVERGICRADRRRMPVAKRQAIRKFESCIVHHEKESLHLPRHAANFTERGLKTRNFLV